MVQTSKLNVDFVPQTKFNSICGLEKSTQANLPQQ